MNATVIKAEFTGSKGAQLAARLDLLAGRSRGRIRIRYRPIADGRF